MWHSLFMVGVMHIRREGRGREGERTPLNQNHDKCLTFTPHGSGTGIAFCDLSSCYNFDLCYARINFLITLLLKL